ncbi:MAG: glycosyltransferase family 1 protein [Gammaproteobacteria bacterium]|nr:MAG: glycosyltransferase family 1 protein [Gammaproteobacteria bacterium]
MKILFLSHRYADTVIGGLAEFLHYLPLALQAYGVNSIIYTQAKNKNTTQLLAPELLSNHILHYTGPFLKPRFFPAKNELLPLITLCQQEKIDLIHAQGTYRAGYMAMHASKHTGIPYIITSHSDILEANSKRLQRRNIQKRCQKILRQAAFVTHLTPLMTQASHQLYDTSDKSEIIHNGIDVAAWRTYPHQPMQDYLFAIGRLEPEKGFSILIDAYAALRKQGITTSLVIAGTGSHEAALQAQAKQLGLEVVTDFQVGMPIPKASLIFTGYVRGDEKKHLFSQARLILFPTQPNAWQEAFGIVLLEAMAAGKAIVASDSSTSRYLQTLGMQAQLVTPDRVSAWVQAIASLLSHPSLGETMGQDNHRYIETFAWEKIAKAYATVYQKASNSCQKEGGCV